MKSKIYIIFVFCSLGSSVISCFYPCPEPDSPYFRINDITSYNMRFTNSGTNPWEFVEDHSTIQWEKFFIRFGLKVDYISHHQHTPTGTLLAKDCNELGYAGDKIGVDTIIVKTMNDYNESYLSGDTINDIILTSGSTRFVEDFAKFTPLSSYINEYKDGIRSSDLS